MRPAKTKLYSIDEAMTVITSWKASGEKMVFTNGCFDILHLGHVDYLEKARLLGTKLIVAVNTDQSIQKIKGPTRPIISEQSRNTVLASLECVDMVIPFGSDTPLELINAVQPEILVKGNDYESTCTDVNSSKYIVGSAQVLEYGGQVQTIELVEGYSTTNIINKIKLEG